VEVVGIADGAGGLSMSEERASDFGDNFDIGNYEALVRDIVRYVPCGLGAFNC
jgi:hypothetical protein